jgi:hypothetical protein
LVSYEICFGNRVGIGSRRMRFPVAAKMTFKAPVQTAAALPWRLFLATDCRSSASRLCRIRQPTNIRRGRVPADIPCMTVVVAGQSKSRTACSHHIAAVNVGNLRWRISAVRQDDSAKYFFRTARVVSRGGSAA